MTSLPSTPAACIDPADANHEHCPLHGCVKYVCCVPSTPQDLSNLDAMTDAELTNALAIAQGAFKLARAADPRRTGLTYSDAKLALNVIDRAHRARRVAVLIEGQQAVSAVRLPVTIPAPREQAVRAATARRGLASVFAATPADDAF